MNSQQVSLNSSMLPEVFTHITEYVKQLEEKNKELTQQNTELTQQVNIRKQSRLSEKNDIITRLEGEVKALNIRINHKEDYIIKLQDKLGKKDMMLTKLSGGNHIIDTEDSVFTRKHICKWWEQGTCKFCSDTCKFAHGEDRVGTRFTIDKNGFVVDQ